MKQESVSKTGSSQCHLATCLSWHRLGSSLRVSMPQGHCMLSGQADLGVPRMLVLKTKNILPRPPGTETEAQSVTRK